MMEINSCDDKEWIKKKKSFQFWYLIVKYCPMKVFVMKILQMALGETNHIST